MTAAPVLFLLRPGTGVGAPQEAIRVGRAPAPAMAWVIAVVSGLILLAVP